MPTIAPVEAGAHVEWAGFLADKPAFATTDGEVLLVEGGVMRVQPHAGLAAAVAALDGSGLLTAGDDGSVHEVRADGSHRVVIEPNGKWATALASGPSGAVAAAYGRSGVALAGGKTIPFSSERTIEALAFAPKGLRLALARYNGVELIWLGTAAPPQFLEWKGAHIAVTFSPDGRYVVTSMQENALHGWRIADNRHMRMTGYPSKVRSLSWSSKGRWLASTGAPAAITWPFSGKDGPMGKAPKELGALGTVMTTRVACHPDTDVVAIGYQDGTILAVRIEDGREASLRRAGGDAISALGWDRSGRRLAFGTAGGDAGVIDIAG